MSEACKETFYMIYKAYLCMKEWVSDEFKSELEAHIDRIQEYYPEFRERFNLESETK